MDQPLGAAAPAKAATPSVSEADQDKATIARVHGFLKAKDDTQNFVGLALLKSLLDNSPLLREDVEVLRDLWASLSSKFMDRLLRTGSKPSKDNSKEMLDLAVSVLHTFAILLPEQARGQSKFTKRIPALVGAVLYSSEDTTKLLLQLLHTLVSSSEGAQALVKLEDLTSLTEIAPAHSIVLDILSFAWLTAMAVTEDKTLLAAQVSVTLQNLVSSFATTDAVTLLEFLGAFLRQADTAIIPSDPKWLKTVVGFIQNLVTSRPTPEARSAYTNAAASLLQTYQRTATTLLFTVNKDDDEKPFTYLIINLMLIDIRSSAPMLLEQLNSPKYPKISRRLASAFDVVCIFIGFLVLSLEDDSLDTLVMSSSNLLKLRKGISETMSVAIEYLRDRWDASVAGAMGLHPDARAGAAETAMGSRQTLTWDSLENIADEDPFILSTIRALALWLREDENDMLRREATGLTDMLMELYQGSSPDKIDFRSPVLVALEALVTFEQGRELLLNHGGWRVLTKDLIDILQQTAPLNLEGDALRGVDIIRVLLQVAEESSTETAEDWMDIVTAVAALDVSHEGPRNPTTLELQVAALQLCCTQLVRANSGMRRRYVHSTSALAGIATQLERDIAGDSFLRESIVDVLDAFKAMSIQT